MFQFRAKIHKSGSKIRVYDGERFLREVTACHASPGFCDKRGN